MTHICVSKLTIIGSDNGLSPGRRQAIIWTNAGILLMGPLRTNFNETSIETHTFSFKKIYLKLSSAKWRPFCPGLNVFSSFQRFQLTLWQLCFRQWLCFEQAKNITCPCHIHWRKYASPGLKKLMHQFIYSAVDKLSPSRQKRLITRSGDATWPSKSPDGRPNFRSLGTWLNRKHVNFELMTKKQISFKW